MIRGRAVQITKIINNNIVISKDNSHREVVLMGRGLGFNAHKGDIIDSKKIEKTYIMKDHEMTHRFQQMVADIPIERLEICNEIIQYAKDTLQKNINDNIYISLTDHINFAIERVEMGVPFQNPFMWEIKKFYYQEYLIGKVAIAMIERKLKVTLPQDEAAFIALHIVNAELDLDMTRMVSMTKLVNHILKIVEDCFPDQLDKESVFYERFITHLKFFAQRVFAGKEVESNDTEFQEIIRNKYRECLDCVEKIRVYIKETCNHDITDEEMMYLTVHIKRVTTK
nr:PRD domain-containing protein [Anaerostipes faecalis]